MTRLACTLAALLATGCATMPDIKRGGLPLGKSGWQFSGGMDFERKVWVLTFWRPWGAAETQAAIDAEKIVLPE
jgi:hypothetical protein